MIIAMDYPFEKKRYTLLEGMTLFFEGRTALLNLTTIGKKFVSVLTADMDIKNIPYLSSGVSFGGPFSYQIAALDERIDGIIYCYGFSNIREMFTLHLKYKVDNYLLRYISGILFEIFFFPMEPLRWTHINKDKPSLFLKATRDEDVPTAYIIPFASMHSSRTIRTYSGKHLRTNDKELIRKISIDIRKWLNKNFN